MDNEERKIIDEIKGSLQDFELPYEDGSWEDFQHKYGATLDADKTKTHLWPMRYWRYGAAAAMLIGVLISTLLLWENEPAIPENKMATNRKANEINQESKAKEALQLEYPAPGIEALSIQNRQKQNTAKEITEQGTNAVVSASSFTKEKLQTILHKELGIAQQSVEPIAIKVDQKPEHLQEQFLLAAQPPQQAKAKVDRWKFGMEVNGAVSSSTPNMALGLSSEFLLTKKIRLSAGITYSHVKAIHQIDPITVSYTTKIVGGQSDIKAIDIPVALIYEPIEGWFSSVGLSAFAVLTEDKIQKVQTEMLTERIKEDPINGNSITVFEVFTSQREEKINETDFKGRSNLGYLNISVGRKQKINKRTDIIVEPFLKVPMGALNHNNVNLLNSGIKLKMLF